MAPIFDQYIYEYPSFSLDQLEDLVDLCQIVFNSNLGFREEDVLSFLNRYICETGYIILATCIFVEGQLVAIFAK